MIIERFIQRASIAGAAVFILAASASADQIVSYTTNSAGTEFVATSGGPITNGGLTLDSALGDGATLTFVPNTTSASGVPSNIDLGDFLLVCPTCSGAQTTQFDAFTFDLVVDDTTDNATGEFVGISTGGIVSSNSSTIAVDWQSPLTMGPGTTNVLTGNFGPTIFDKVTNITSIVAPNSGTPPGDTTVQGQVSSSAVPEPASSVLIAAGLLFLGSLRRTKVLRP